MTIDIRKVEPDLRYALKDVANILGLAYGTVLNLKKKNVLPVVKIGKKFFVHGKDILTYIEKGTFIQ